MFEGRSGEFQRYLRSREIFLSPRWGPCSATCSPVCNDVKESYGRGLEERQSGHPHGLR